MLQETNVIDVIFYGENSGPCPTTIFVETGEWNHSQSLDWLKQKLNHYEQQLTSGVLLKKRAYKKCIFKSISLSSKDPIPQTAVKILEGKKEELAKIGISLSYEHVPDLDD